MTKINPAHDFAQQLPNEVIPNFYGELLDHIAHDERSYGPNPFTLLVPMIVKKDNPKDLFLAIVEKTTKEEKPWVMKTAYVYIQDVLAAMCPPETSNSPKAEDISEEDLPF